ncbi:MAG: hypothetical protein K2W80_02195 [Burkholderiales bacterium]|nr:hypothetical protein [Burkholderiales bacterium]
MTVGQLIQQALADGVTLRIGGAGRLRVVGPAAAIERWTPTIKAMKPAILAALEDDVEGADHEPHHDRTSAADDPFPISDNRRTCRDCNHLVGAFCRVSTSRGKWRPIPDLPHRCEYYSPGADDPDRRSASARWALAGRAGL